MCLSVAERDSIQGLVATSKETEDIARKLSEFLAKDLGFQEKARAFAMSKGPLSAVGRVRLAKR
jgi:hypothetical protein